MYVLAEREKVYILNNTLALFYDAGINIRLNVLGGISPERQNIA